LFDDKFWGKVGEECWIGVVGCSRCGGPSFVRMTNLGRNVGGGVWWEVVAALVVCSGCGDPSFVRMTMLGGDVVQGGIK